MLSVTNNIALEKVKYIN